MSRLRRYEFFTKEERDRHFNSLKSMPIERLREDREYLLYEKYDRYVPSFDSEFSFDIIITPVKLFRLQGDYVYFWHTEFNVESYNVNWLCKCVV